MSNTFDEDAFVREVSHAQMMWRLSYKQECERRHARMEWNEAQANEAMILSKEEMIQESLRNRNQQTLLSEQLEKQRKNELFWGRVVKTIATLVVVFTLIYFAGWV